MCHQSPLRSIHADGQRIFLCARCTGVYTALGVSYWFTFFVMYRRHRIPHMLRYMYTPISMFAAGVILAWIEGKGFINLSNELRPAAGALIGLPIGAALATAFISVNAKPLPETLSPFLYDAFFIGLWVLVSLGVWYEAKEGRETALLVLSVMPALGIVTGYIAGNMTAASIVTGTSIKSQPLRVIAVATFLLCGEWILLYLLNG